ncbi:peroxiredoxin, Ohr subfamily [Cohaesibacter marisflavi]|uniref:Peroxiredoxin, Ohr subfamily n=1 Tax=Cohaesibacter marisflavi TaxID=655353 RepID=A0A1I5EH29_9HYPH|nr:organic hydroperoxide resistance protein [Cohaesibacter marisflavi]SFO10839.1 peroxiredoxin, Ohr subfamily [Cohaesibacter marisflavi]
MKVLYSTSATATGGREGSAKSEDGLLNVTLVTPKELGGAGGNGTNPEQMFAAGYAACFLSAVKLIASQEKVTLTDPTITAEVGIGNNDNGEGFSLKVDLVADLKGVDAETATKLVEKAHQVCPYSNATRNNIEVSVAAK